MFIVAVYCILVSKSLIPIQEIAKKISESFRMFKHQGYGENSRALKSFIQNPGRYGLDNQRYTTEDLMENSKPTVNSN